MRLEWYIAEAEKQFSYETTYRDVNFKDRILQELVTSEKELKLKYFIIDFKKATNLGKLSLLPKIHKRLDNATGCPVISWKYNIRRSVNSDFSIVTIRRVAFYIFWTRSCKRFHANILMARHFMITFLFKSCPWLQQFQR